MIQLKNIQKSFDGRKVLRGIDLEIRQGSITVILGPSGEGKSVLLKHIIGLMQPDAGQVLIDGEDIVGMDEATLNEVRKKFGMLFQSAALFDSLSVEQNVAFPLKEHTALSPEEIHETVREKLRLVGLEQEGMKRPDQLSGGMRKRVGLARAIALQPEIILYDEPTTGLDPLTTEQINRLIVEMQRKLHVTSVVISHDIESTFAVADQVAMLHEGRIIEEGSPEKFQQSSHPFVREFLSKGKH